ncbi:MAG: hypothetical protein ACM3JH_10755 [Acidithiobacillales bacterium]
MRRVSVTRTASALWASVPGLLAAFLLLGSALPAEGVPVFARKYHTSCQTCHTIFPKLNPFGEAFRLNGYHLPGETEEQVKETPVSLGSEAYAKMWPDMLYPSTLPGNVPLAVNVQIADLYASSHDETGKTITHNDFQFPQEANLFGAGTLGNHFSFLAEVTFAENPDGSSEVEIEHARIDVISAFGPKHLFNFRIGKLAPNLYDGFQEMWIMTFNAIDTLFGYGPVGYNGGTGITEEGGFSLPDRMRAIEMYGVAAHRLFYTVGFGNPIGPGSPNGNFNNNSFKDYYGRIDYKFGGMGLDGDTTGVTLPPENWRETSFRVGVFGYHGDNSGIDFPVTDPEGNPFNMQQGIFKRVGIYGSLLFGDLNLFGAAVHGTDELSLRDSTTGEELSGMKRTYDTWFLEADYVIKPPFQLAVRYENLRPGDSSVHPLQLLTSDFSFLVRANIKLILESRLDLHDTQNYEIATAVRAAF